MTEFSIGFSQQADGTVSASVTERDELAEHEQVWIWDLYYARVLYTLGDSPQAAELRESLDGWAVQMASKAFLPMHKIEQAGLHRLHPDLLLVADTGGTENVYRIEVRRSQGEWPVIHTAEPEPADARLRSLAVFALAQYFFLKNRLFRREVALHVLAFRKYYLDVRPHTDPVSMVEAPLFAVNKALEFFESLKRERAMEQGGGRPS